MSILNNPSRWAGTDNLYKEDREEEASLILVLQECAEYVNNTDITKLTVQPIHGCSHLWWKGGELAAAHPRSITGPSKPLGRSKSRILGCPENPRGESQIPILKTKADQEPILQIDLEGKTTPMILDTGAVYTCVNSNDVSHLPLSGKFAKTIGFSGQMQLIPLTAPVCPEMKNKSVTMPILV